MPNRSIDAAGRVRRLGDLGQRAAILVGRHDIGNPPVGQPPGAGQRGVGSAAAPDRRPARLARRRLHRYVGERAEIAPVMADRLAAPQLPQQRDRRRQPRAALVAWHPRDREFLGEFAADPDTEDQPPLAQMVEARDLLGDRPRMAQRQQVDVGPERQPPADHRRLRQLQQRVEDRHGERQMVADPQRIVAASIDQPDQLDQFVDRRQPRSGRRLGAAVDRLDADPRSNGSSSSVMSRVSFASGRNVTAMSAQLAAPWINFFGTAAEAAATLAGLVMVAISVNVQRIIAFRHLPLRAGVTIAALVLNLIASMAALIPQPLFALGAEILVFALIVWVWLVWVSR